MPTKTQIFNDAAAYNGLSGVVDWADGSPLSLAYQQAWPTLVRGLLESHPWNFASATEPLAASATESAASRGRQYCFGLPQGFLRLNWVSITARQEEQVDSGWAREGAYVWADYLTLYMNFVRDLYVEETGLWPLSFGAVVSAQLARSRARTLSDSRAMLADLADIERMALAEAKFQDAASSPMMRRQPGRWNRARNGY